MDIGNNGNAGNGARKAEVFSDPIKLQMEVLDPQSPVREEAPFDASSRGPAA
jgi:hypothetical protein